MALIGRHLVPAECGVGVCRSMAALIIHPTQSVLGVGVALSGSHSPPRHHLGVVARNAAAAAQHYAKAVLCAAVSTPRRFTIPPNRFLRIDGQGIPILVQAPKILLYCSLRPGGSLSIPTDRRSKILRNAFPLLMDDAKAVLSLSIALGGRPPPPSDRLTQVARQTRPPAAIVDETDSVLGIVLAGLRQRLPPTQRDRVVLSSKRRLTLHVGHGFDTTLCRLKQSDHSLSKPVHHIASCRLTACGCSHGPEGNEGLMVTLVR